MQLCTKQGVTWCPRWSIYIPSPITSSSCYTLAHPVSVCPFARYVFFQCINNNNNNNLSWVISPCIIQCTSTYNNKYETSWITNSLGEPLKRAFNAFIAIGAYDSITAWHLCLRDLAWEVPLTMGCACSFGYYCGIDDDGKEGVLYWLWWSVYYDEVYVCHVFVYSELSARGAKQDAR